MPKYLVAIAGQNFESSIFDTEDLSTIRGGSLLFRNAIAGLADLHPEAMTISNSGDSGIWQFTEKTDAQKFELRANSGLAQAAGLSLDDVPKYVTQHATFVTALVEDDPDADQKLDATIRRKQLDHGSLIYPAIAGDQLDGYSLVCPVDLSRPTSGKSEAEQSSSERNYYVSESVAARRRYGLRAKQQFLTQIAQKDAKHKLKITSDDHWPFAMQIDSISESAAPPMGLRSNLHDKIAVIHLDGNGFGAALEKLKKANSDGPMEAIKNFEASVVSLRKRIVCAALDEVLGDANGVGKPSRTEALVRQSLKGTRERVIRFETLMWGGDEILIIVPARLGFQVLESVMAVHQGQDLSHAVGIIFCHHDAPISRITRLADDVSTLVKARGKDISRSLALVLESFDHVGGELEEHLARRTPTDKSKHFYTLDHDEIHDLRQLAQQLVTADTPLARRQLRKAAVAIHKGAATGAECEIARRAISSARPTMSNDEVDRRIVLLEEYWDYLLPIAEVVS